MNNSNLVSHHVKIPIYTGIPSQLEMARGTGASIIFRKSFLLIFTAESMSISPLTTSISTPRANAVAHARSPRFSSGSRQRKTSHILVQYVRHITDHLKQAIVLPFLHLTAGHVSSIWHEFIDLCHPLVGVRQAIPVRSRSSGSRIPMLLLNRNNHYKVQAICIEEQAFCVRWMARNIVDQVRGSNRLHIVSHPDLTDSNVLIDT
jgi:hypothetical protein